ncbi:protein mono-ADP-ribosyltransferase PARP12-like [Montipora foliosa]|uniref:protein mono-ADP-ribosyltransferase PARP12-like n=1 Tax=Montipora foliosa TaxID=591990 RepID=UPI0035F1EDE9
MAEGDVSVVKVFNYICGLGGFAHLSQLLQQPSPLAKKDNASSVISWYKTAKKSGSFTVNGLLLATSENGNASGIRINLKQRLCLKYSSSGCHLAGKCPFWHLCKTFLEGTCKGNCGRSHDFHDDNNKSKTAELGFEKKTNDNMRGIIAGSLPQVCRSYLKSECVTRYCPHLHICPKQVLATECDHECHLSHDFCLPHNKNILGHFGFKPPQTFKIEVVRCNILVPKQQRAFKDKEKELELTRDRDRPVMENLIGQATRKSAANDQTFSKQTRAKLATLSRMVEEAKKAKEMVTASMSQTAPTTDTLLTKVLNYVHGEGGVATLSRLLHPPSPLAKKFSATDDAKIWLQNQAQSDQSPKICLLENEEGETLGVRVLLKKKLCLKYSSPVSCERPRCPFWHVCKGYLEGTCSGDCVLSHDFLDEGNIKKVQMLGLEKRPRGMIKNIVASSLPQVCLSYLKNECFSTGCPYLHICSFAAQGMSCNCNLSHELANADPHNMNILMQFELVPQPSKLSLVYCNILIPQQQKKFIEDKPNKGFLLSSPSRTSNMKSVSDIQPLMSLPCGDEMRGNIETSTKKKKKKGERKRAKRRSKKKTCQDKQIGGLKDSCANEEGLEQNSSDSDSDSDNEDAEKPDLYASSKFTVDLDSTGSKDFSKEDPIPGRHVSTPIEENLISLSDDDWQGVNDPVKSPFFSNNEFSVPKERAKPERTEVPYISDISWESVSILESDVLKPQHHGSSFDLPIPLVPESPSAGPSRFPLQWEPVPEDVEYICVPLPTGFGEFKLAESYFHRSMSSKATILVIERVQNPFMWEKYARKKEQLEKRSSRLQNCPVNEKLLFHGADWQNLRSVYEENIDWRAQDEDRVAAFGQGAYFTAEANLGNTYCKQDPEGVRYMFLAEVLVGSSAKGEPSMKRPPQKSDAASNERYDSCVDNMDRPSIYVLFDSDRYYPTYMIQYKMK